MNHLAVCFSQTRLAEAESLQHTSVPRLMYVQQVELRFYDSQQT